LLFATLTADADENGVNNDNNDDHDDDNNDNDDETTQSDDKSYAALQQSASTNVGNSRTASQQSQRHSQPLKSPSHLFRLQVFLRC
jgi:hypothetical protein